MPSKKTLLSCTLCCLILFSSTACSVAQTESSPPANAQAKKSAPAQNKNQNKVKAGKPANPKITTAESRNTEWVWPLESEAELKQQADLETLSLERPLIKSFVEKMVVEHGFTKEYIETTLKQAINKTSILKIISRPAEKSKEWFEYRAIFLTDKRIQQGKAFLQAHAHDLSLAEQKYGVPKEIITAIIGIETFYGRITGKYKVLDALVTLGFNYPPRAKFFRTELEQFFILSREENFKPTEVLGSYAGAMGNGQFISSSYRNFTADGDGDGKRDLWNSWPDVIHSVANYFNTHQWKTGEPILATAAIPENFHTVFPKSKVSLTEHTIQSLRGNYNIKFDSNLPDSDPAMILVMQQKSSTDYLVGFNNFYSITRYNRSPMYARAVYQLSQELSK